MDSRDFISALKTGDDESFRVLIERYQVRVINTCYRFLQNMEDAEDTAQEVFLQVYKSIGEFREDAKLSTWIYRIAVSKSLDFARRNNRKKRIGRLRNILRIEAHREQIPATAVNNPETDLENKERRMILDRAIASLHENQRIAITLGTCEGYSYREIAEIMNTTVSCVEALIHRARKNLKKKLHHYYDKHLEKD
jgi:RNA polymerase sigma-70 factor (ECF subfamily)